MTMMQWKKPIRNNGGFTLVEMLVAFSCVAVSCVLLMPVVSALQRLQEPVYYRRRLVRRSGYEIFLQDVDALQFQKRKECYYVTWVRKEKREEALLTCE